MQRIACDERGEYRIAEEELFGKPEEHFFLAGLIVEDTEAELGGKDCHKNRVAAYPETVVSVPVGIVEHMCDDTLLAQ